MIRRFTIAAALAGLVALGAGTVYAHGSESLRATVPFDFKVGQTLLPAGRYDVSYDPAESGVLTVRSEDGRHTAVALTDGVSTGNSKKEGRLVFDRQGSGYTLSRVFGPGEDTGLEVAMGSRIAPRLSAR
jgi:hypothetical protein